ncbi:hypothetical protein EYZ11_009259 [Aspergillus tanneri]|uniref:Putative gamma-glutamylcyclotransferase n=1 Tax=Aspergillus tanneri TaxID=1220188 RepID=A0A4S3J8R4_9EURO|nr:uncharacterized protein ATNIH1004_009144 [Aspergillus tanneri]KAA8644933.1 hypothetical protein ATNIH1004_009144 [Aspergillus tanneri]THC91282.1 hypothetical protein EYZ11_009259 [Aspergillus tanneri]
MSQESKDPKTPKFPSLFPAKAEPSSPFYAMLKSAPQDYLLQQDERHEFPPDYPVYYFFYGTLSAPSQLKRIIDLPDEPKLRKAEIFGYTIAKWGDYPALINGRQGQVVTGYAYLVRSKEEAQKLSYYETNAYTVADCWIYFRDEEEPKEVGGKVFMYAGDAQALLEQRFDRKLWRMQMGGKLE